MILNSASKTRTNESVLESLLKLIRVVQNDKESKGDGNYKPLKDVIDFNETVVSLERCMNEALLNNYALPMNEFIGPLKDEYHRLKTIYDAVLNKMRSAGKSRRFNKIFADSKQVGSDRIKRDNLNKIFDGIRLEYLKYLTDTQSKLHQYTRAAISKVQLEIEAKSVIKPPRSILEKFSKVLDPRTMSMNSMFTDKDDTSTLADVSQVGTRRESHETSSSTATDKATTKEGRLMVVYNSGTFAKDGSPLKARFAVLDKTSICILNESEERDQVILKLDLESCTVRRNPKSSLMIEIISRKVPSIRRRKSVFRKLTGDSVISAASISTDRSRSFNGYFLGLVAETDSEASEWFNQIQTNVQSLIQYDVCAESKSKPADVELTFRSEITVGDKEIDLAKNHEIYEADLFPLSGADLLDLIHASSDENRECADCYSTNPDWISLTTGALICKHCAGLHRDMPDFKVRSVLMDRSCWRNGYVEDWLACGGNKSVNRIYGNVKCDDVKSKYDSETKMADQMEWGRKLLKMLVDAKITAVDGQY